MTDSVKRWRTEARKMEIYLPQPMWAALDDAAKTGLFGTTVADVLKRAATEYLRQLDKDGFINLEKAHGRKDDKSA